MHTKLPPTHALAQQLVAKGYSVKQQALMDSAGTVAAWRLFVRRGEQTLEVRLYRGETELFGLVYYRELITEVFDSMTPEQFWDTLEALAS